MTSPTMTQTIVLALMLFCLCLDDLFSADDPVKEPAKEPVMLAPEMPVITVNFQDSSLEQVFKEISQRTGHTITVDWQDLRMTAGIARNKSIRMTLKAPADRILDFVLWEAGTESEHKKAIDWRMSPPPAKRTNQSEKRSIRIASWAKVSEPLTQRNYHLNQLINRDMAWEYLPMQMEGKRAALKKVRSLLTDNSIDELRRWALLNFTINDTLKKIHWRDTETGKNHDAHSLEPEKLIAFAGKRDRWRLIYGRSRIEARVMDRHLFIKAEPNDQQWFVNLLLILKRMKSKPTLSPVDLPEMSLGSAGKGRLNRNWKSALRELKQTICVNYKKESVGQVIQDLRKMTGLNIHMRWQLLSQLKIDPDRQIDLRLKNVTLSTLLDQLVKRLSTDAEITLPLKWDLDGDVIIISFAYDLAYMKYTRLYWIDDLILESDRMELVKVQRERLKKFNEAISEMEQLLHDNDKPQIQKLLGMVIALEKADDQIKQTELSQYLKKRQKVIEILQMQLSPTQTSPKEYELFEDRLLPGMLVLRSDRRRQDRFEQLLTHLRAIKSSKTSVITVEPAKTSNDKP